MCVQVTTGPQTEGVLRDEDYVSALELIEDTVSLLQARFGLLLEGERYAA